MQIFQKFALALAQTRSTNNHPHPFRDFKLLDDFFDFIEKQGKEVDRMHRLEERRIPPNVDYDSFVGLRFEACQKLGRFRPATLGQASRIDGVTPADIAILLVHLERGRRGGVS